MQITSSDLYRIVNQISAENAHRALATIPATERAFWEEASQVLDSLPRKLDSILYPAQAYHVCRVRVEEIAGYDAQRTPEWERLRSDEEHDQISDWGRISNELNLHVADGLFTVTAWKHPYGFSKLYPKGTFYGQVEGIDATAPCTSPERAIHGAKISIVNGQLAAGLLDDIKCYQSWIDQGLFDTPGKKISGKTIEDLAARVQKSKAMLGTLQNVGLLRRRHADALAEIENEGIELRP